MYYDINQTRAVSDKEMQQRGLPLNAPDMLEHLGFYPLTIEKPEYDPATQGVEPDGYPAPDAANPRAFVQHMCVFSIMERAKEKKKAAASAKRWEYETGGIITPDGIQILTGIDDQNRISTAIQGMKQAGMTETDFKAASGWVKLTLEQLEQLAAMIAVHVQKCFAHERYFHEQIDACETLEQLNAINLDEGWREETVTEPEEPTNDATTEEVIEQPVTQTTEEKAKENS